MAFSVRRPGPTWNQPAAIAPSSHEALARWAVAGACAAGLATGWNNANTGAVAGLLAGSYHVGLAEVGLFTTALFLTHMAMQIPAGRASERFGPRRTALTGLAVIACANAIALAASNPMLAMVARALAGVGTGLTFVSCSAYVRASGGSPFAQGVFGGVGLGGGGLSLMVVPWVAGWLGWRAPYVTALAVGTVALLGLMACPSDGPRRPSRHQNSVPVGLFGDSRLYRLAAVYAASLGLSVVSGNWIVTLIERNSDVPPGAAGAIGGITLVLPILTRPLGGWILNVHPRRIRMAVGLSLVAGALGTLALVTVASPVLVVLGVVLVGIAAGIPFSPAFTGAALTRPDAPVAAVGLVNSAASLVIVVGTPLVGLTFALPGAGRAGFAVMAVLWLAALLAMPTSKVLGARE